MTNKHNLLQAVILTHNQNFSRFTNTSFSSLAMASEVIECDAFCTHTDCVHTRSY